MSISYHMSISFACRSSRTKKKKKNASYVENEDFCFLWAADHRLLSTVVHYSLFFSFCAKSYKNPTGTPLRLSLPLQYRRQLSMEAVETPPPARPSGKLRRQRSRLQMQAPSSIQVCPAALRDASEWKVAIPLLSPLDSPSLPTLGDPTAETPPPPEGKRVEESEGGARRPAWQHPAAPFYYEPVPGNAPAFPVPHRT